VAAQHHHPAVDRWVRGQATDQLGGGRRAALEQRRVVVDGQASVRRDGRLIATLGPGDFVGEMSLIAGTPRSATVIAETDMLVETLNRREFSTLLDESPKVARKIMVGTVKRLQEAVGGPVA